MRYDETVLGKRDERFDVVCAKCRSAIGFPCTEKKLDGSECVSYVHLERIQDVLDNSKR